MTSKTFTLSAKARTEIIALIKKPAREFAIGEKACFGMRSFGDDGRESYKNIKQLIKKGRKWAYWGLTNGEIIKKTLMDEMIEFIQPEEEPEEEPEED
jgi:hypothetical protein